MASIKMATGEFPAWGPSFDPTKYTRKPPGCEQVSKKPTAVQTESHVERAARVNSQEKAGLPLQQKSPIFPTRKASNESKAKLQHMVTPEHSSIPERTKPTTQTMGLQAMALKTERADPNMQTAEAEQTDPSETLRLVSIREISKLHSAKVGQRWMTFAEIDGWTCLVPPRAFKAGELVVYLEVDSMIPASDDRFGTMNTLQTFEGKLCHRVKTRRFGSGEEKIVVQGYVYPIEKFQCIYRQVETVRWALELSLGKRLSQKKMNAITLAMYRRENWAERLGIKKWEETAQGPSSAHEHPRLGRTPTHLFNKTDITRVEDCPNLFSKVKYTRREYQESVKMDGTSMTVYFVNKQSRRIGELNPLPEAVGPNTVLDNGRFGVCSKSIDLNELNSCSIGYWKTALQYDLPTKLSKLGKNIAIQGELCGPGINKNREKIREGQTEFFVYAMFDMDRQKYVDPRKVVDLAAQLGLKHVPVLGYVRIPEIAQDREDLKRRARQRKGEGLVYKCLVDGRAFKVISSTYLLEHNV